MVVENLLPLSIVINLLAGIHEGRNNFNNDKTMTQKKKTKHEGNEGTVGFWLYMKALYKDGI